MQQKHSYYDDRGNTLNILDKNGTILSRDKFPSLKAIFQGYNSSINIINPMRIKSCTIICGSNCSIIIGNSCDIVGNLSIFATAEHSCVKIENNCSFSGVDIRLQSEPHLSITIGDHCLFSSGITIRSSDSHTVFDINTLKAINIPKSISIGNHVWIGFGVDILKNSILPNNCIVAARSLISGVFTEENCVLGGIPAKIIKKGVNWSWDNTYNYNLK